MRKCAAVIYIIIDLFNSLKGNKQQLFTQLHKFIVVHMVMNSDYSQNYTMLQELIRYRTQLCKFKVAYFVTSTSYSHNYASSK